MTQRRYASTVTEALDRADARHWTRQPPRSHRSRTRYLLQHTHNDPQALATLLAVPKNDILGALAGDTPTDTQAAKTERELLRQWQPQVRRRAHRTILDNGGLLTVSFRAWFGFTAAVGTTDDPRLRFLTTSLCAPYPERLFTAHHRSSPEQELHRILGEALAASYFHQRTSSHTQEAVTLQKIDYLEFSY
ncbi:telomere-protecting terminal protein Tpg [Streptomyces sp. NPDC102451]|uniref:telomere-protecting terminal protein Tpg n=1 Tax=Streptomyces sp. NPDC102451 TaxID=3366177 RepID=UPI0038143BCB